MQINRLDFAYNCPLADCPEQASKLGMCRIVKVILQAISVVKINHTGEFVGFMTHLALIARVNGHRSAYDGSPNALDAP